jgi:hypothetical protein
MESPVRVEEVTAGHGERVGQWRQGAWWRTWLR